MRITGVTFRRIYGVHATVRANLSIVVDNELAIHDIVLVAREGKLKMFMPSVATNRYFNGKQMTRDIAHPICADARNKMEATIFRAYRLVLRECTEKWETFCNAFKVCPTQRKIESILNTTEIPELKDVIVKLMITRRAVELNEFSTSTPEELQQDYEMYEGSQQPVMN